MAEKSCWADMLASTVDFTACACRLLLPNAFTPDGDGRNDRFRPLHAGEMSNFEMDIYDWFGARVYHGADPGEGCNGYFGGAKAPA